MLCREICLSHNNLTNIPPSLLGLKQLNILDLSENKITKIPSDISRLQATELVLNRNQVRPRKILIRWSSAMGWGPFQQISATFQRGKILFFSFMNRH